MKLSTHLCVVLRLRVSGVLLPLPHMASRHSWEQLDWLYINYQLDALIIIYS